MYFRCGPIDGPERKKTTHSSHSPSSPSQPPWPLTQLVGVTGRPGRFIGWPFFCRASPAGCSQPTIASSSYAARGDGAADGCLQAVVRPSRLGPPSGRAATDRHKAATDRLLLHSKHKFGCVSCRRPALESSGRGALHLETLSGRKTTWPIRVDLYSATPLLKASGVALKRAFPSPLLRCERCQQ